MSATKLLVKKATESPARNSCVRCAFEKTCGYSPLATLDHRTEQSNTPCCLGDRSSGKGPFFQAKH